jgi:hypothetical protein
MLPMTTRIFTQEFPSEGKLNGKIDFFIPFHFTPLDVIYFALMSTLYHILSLKQKFYDLLEEEILKASPEDMLSMGCTINKKKFVDKAIANKARNFDQGLIKACDNGHIAMVEYMLELGATNYNMGLLHACDNGNRKIIRKMIDCGADNIDKIRQDEFIKSSVKEYVESLVNSK